MEVICLNNEKLLITKKDCERFELLKERKKLCISKYELNMILKTKNIEDIRLNLINLCYYLKLRQSEKNKLEKYLKKNYSLQMLDKTVAIQHEILEKIKNYEQIIFLDEY